MIAERHFEPNGFCPSFDFLEAVIAPKICVEQSMPRLFIGALGFDLGNDVIEVAHLVTIVLGKGRCAALYRAASSDRRERP